MARRRALAALAVVALAAHVVAPASADIHLTTGVIASCRDPSRRASTHRRLSAISAAEAKPAGFSDARWGPHLGRQQYILSLASGTPAHEQRAIADRLESPAYGGVVSGYLPDDAWLVLLPPHGAARLAAELQEEQQQRQQRQQQGGAAAAANSSGHALLEYEPRHKVAPEWAAVLDALEEQRRRLGGWPQEQQQQQRERRRDGGAAAEALDRASAWLAAARAAWRDLSSLVAAPAADGQQQQQQQEQQEQQQQEQEQQQQRRPGGRHAWACHPRLTKDHPALRAVKVVREPLHAPLPLSNESSSPLLPAAVARDAPHRQRLVIAVHAAPCPRRAAALLAAGAEADRAAGAADAASPVAPEELPAHDPAAAAAADWAEPLARLASDPRGCGPPRVVPLQRAGAPGGAPLALAPSSSFSSASSRAEFSVTACPQDLPRVLDWLSRHPAVHYLHPRGRTELQSNAVATAIMQGGDMGALLAAGAAGAAASRAEEHPAWAAGLTGKGQIVGIGDSGIDVSSCYFNDPAVPFIPSALPLDPATRSRVFASPTHRKLAYYLGAGADAVDNVGHGTHTSGSLAGARLDGKVDAATGAAPGARIAFMDLTSDDSGDVNAPDDLGEGYFSRTYAQGARVHSDSWGSNLVFYDGAAASLDRWTHEHDDFVSVVAAGNYGREQRFNSTVTSPATSKNCIAVGATLNLQQGPGEPPRVPVFRAEFSIRHAASSQAQRVAYYLTQASFGADAAQALVAARAGAPPLPVLRAEPRDGCGASTKPVPAAGGGGAVPDEFVLLLDRGSCNFFDKARHAQAAGAKAVIIANTLPEGYFTLEAPEEDLAANPVTISVFGAPLGVGQVLRAALAEPGTLLDAAFASAPAENFQALPSYENIAQYSSFGPTRPDGRVKPDVVAPGGLVSAAGGPRLLAATAGGGGGGGAGEGQCATAYEQGTSMATPVVAGSVALIRQFFTDGYYPSGAKGSGGVPVPNPSGYLLKAVLLGGASAMQGLSEARLPLEPAPSFRQGFGRVNLTRALGLGGAGRVQAVDRAEIGEGESHTYCISASGGGSGALSITLAWYDPPALPSAGRPLVNDLDLAVRVAAYGGALARGNGAQPGPDTANTVERVSLDGLPAGPVSITVQASRVFPAGSKQAYALVVQGKFTGVLASAANPDPAAKAAPADGGAASCLQLQPPPAPPPDVAAPPPAPPGSQAPVPPGEKQLAADEPARAKGKAAAIERAVAAEQQAAAAAAQAAEPAPADAAEEEEEAGAPDAQESATKTDAPAPPTPTPARARRRRRQGTTTAASDNKGAQEGGRRRGYSAEAVVASSADAPVPAPEPAPAPPGPPPSDQDVLSAMMGSG